jgi:hypothetical protein
MDTYLPSEIHAQERREHARSEAYNDGRADERQKWLPLAAELRTAILLKHQHNGSLTLSLADVLSISAALARAEGA